MKKKFIDTTLGFSIRNGVTKTNSAPGITAINLAKVDQGSICLTITGENTTASAKIAYYLVIDHKYRQTLARSTSV